MAKYLIDTEAGTCIPYKVSRKSPVELMEQDYGAKEWDDTVEKIQKWYYNGKSYHVAWCASAVSYYLKMAGINIPKACNVFKLMQNCKNSGIGRFYDKDHLPRTIKKDDILFWLWKGDTMTAASSKHCGLCAISTDGEKIACIGGNQDNKICTKNYDRKYLYAILRLED